MAAGTVVVIVAVTGGGRVDVRAQVVSRRLVAVVMVTERGRLRQQHTRQQE
jgi:hypothetical protein